MIYLGIDSGTQSTKTIALDLESNEIIAQASQSYSLIPGLPTGHLEQHPEDWFQALESTVRSCLQQLGPDRAAQVRGIGVSGQQHGLVALDGRDQVVRPAKLWCDTSTQAQCDEIHAHFGGMSGLIERNGNPVLTGYTLPKILWLKQEEPDAYEATSTILLPHDYLNFRLTGIKRMEYGDASGTGLLNVRTREWDWELAEWVDPRLPALIPPLESSRSPVGILAKELANQWGLRPDVLVSAGGGDNMMGAIGTGNITAGTITASYGTSGTLFGCAPDPVIDLSGEIAAFCDSTDQWLPLVCTMNVTVVTEQVRQWFGWDLPRLEQEVASVPAGAGGLSFLPYLNGERTPNLPHGCGVIHGLRGHDTTPAHLARAAMEGATLGLAYGLNRFRSLGLSPSEIRLTGGGAQSRMWRQISADAFGVPVVGLAHREGAAIGAAIQAAHTNGQGSYGELCERLVITDESSRALPDAENHAVYQEKLALQETLSTTLKDASLL